jgi:hypothetical protein
MPAGRPSEFRSQTAEFICLRIANGESLRKICLDPDMPASSTVFKWLGEQKEFSEQYARAREAQMEVMAQEIVDIADDNSEDSQFDDNGNTRINSEFVQRSKLRVDTRKWLMSKLAPKKYGEKVDLNHSGEVAIKRVMVR